MHQAAGMESFAMFEQATPTARGFRDVTPRAVAAALHEGLRIVDVRQPTEFLGDLGHVPGATLVPLPTLSHAAREWEPTAPIVLVCRSGGRSSAAAAQLAAAGFTRVMNMLGGMMAYRAANLPLAA